MRRILSVLWFLVSTVFFSTAGVVVSLFDENGEGVHRVGRLWSTLILKVGGVRVVVTGMEHLSNPPYVLVCNHQSGLDIYALMVALPFSFKWMAKRQLFSIPLFGWAIRRAGYISVDRENPRQALKAIDEAAQKMRSGTNILIFPEGTRSVDGQLLPFKKGVFSLALRAMVPIIPIGISGSNRLQPPGHFVPKEKGTVHVNIGEPIVLEGMDRSAKTQVMDDVRARIERLIS